MARKGLKIPEPRIGLEICIIAFAAMFVGFCAWFADARATPALPDSTVKVITDTGHGSGVHIGSGLVLTAAHVTGDEDRVKIKTRDGKEIDGIVLWSNRAYDMTLVHAPQLRAQASPVSCRPVTLGQRVRARGNPLRWEWIEMWGTVSGFVPTTMDDTASVVLNITTLPGMSGGPIFDESGAVVGLVQKGIRGFAFDGMTPMSESCRLLGRV